MFGITNTYISWSILIYDGWFLTMLKKLNAVCILKQNWGNSFDLELEFFPLNIQSLILVTEEFHILGMDLYIQKTQLEILNFIESNNINRGLILSKLHLLIESISKIDTEYCGWYCQHNKEQIRSLILLEYCL